MKPILLLFALTGFLLSCTKPVVQPGVTGNKSSTTITEKWNWIKTEGGISVQVFTPANTGDQRQLEFQNDGTVNYYKNGILQYSGSYTLETSTDPVTGKTLQTITQNYFGMYTQAEIQTLHRDTGNVIKFDEEGADRYIHTYELVAN